MLERSYEAKPAMVDDHNNNNNNYESQSSKGLKYSLASLGIIKARGQVFDLIEKEVTFHFSAFSESIPFSM